MCNLLRAAPKRESLAKVLSGVLQLLPHKVPAFLDRLPVEGGAAGELPYVPREAPPQHHRQVEAGLETVREEVPEFRGEVR